MGIHFENGAATIYTNYGSMNIIYVNGTFHRNNKLGKL